MFKLGPLEIRWYSFMFVISFALGLLIFRKMITREKKPATLYNSILWTVFISVFLGARLGHFLYYEPDAFFNRFWYILIPFENGKFVGYQGLASHGAAVGLLIGLYYYSRKNRVAYLWTLDRIVITVALSGFFIRMGNLMNSEVYGHETNLPWGFIFVKANETVPKHPTQIYEALSYLAIFVFLYLIYLKRKNPLKDGIIFSMFLTVLFTARFLIEFLKEKQVSFEEDMISKTGLDMGQMLSIPFILAGIVLFIYLNRKKTVLTNVNPPKNDTVQKIKKRNNS
jgi:prolipoprotein diacylglyceryl transferase